MNINMIDVCVAGNGPAAAMASRQLAAAGLSVLMVGKPNPRILKFGETLPGAAIRLLRKLGLDMTNLDLRHALSEASWAPSRVGGALTAWGTEKIVTSDALSDPYGLGLRIERTAFDQWLKDEAIAAGTQTHNAYVSTLSRQGRSWSLGFDDGYYAHARWVVDATGRSAKLVRLLGAKRSRGVPLVALYRSCQPELNPDLNRTIIVAGQHGWAYTGQITKGQWVLGYHTIPTIAVGLQASSDHWGEAMDGMGCLSELLGEITFADRIHAHDIRSIWLDQPVGEGWIACGDASIAFDPLAGQGLFHALYTGMKAAEVIWSWARAQDASDLYSKEMGQIYRSYAMRRAHLYRAESRWRESPFWSAHQS